MRYLPFKPLLDLRSFGWEEDEDLPQVSRTSGGLNVYEENGRVKVEAAVPGMDPKDIRVTYEDGVLRISARSEEKKEEKNKGRLVHQWNKVENFEYATYLPRPINTKTIEAKCRNGVLTVSADVSEESKQKEIEVKVG